MFKRITAAVLSLALLTACSIGSQDNKDPLLKALEEVGELSTEKLTLTRIWADSDGNMFQRMTGKKKIVVSLTAYVEVGVDMKEDYNVWYDKTSNNIKLLLPPVKILNINIPVDEVVSEYQSVTGLRSDFTPEDRSYIYKACQDQMEEDVRKAFENDRKSYEEVTRKFFQVMLAHFGYEKIMVEFDNKTKEDNGNE